MRVGFQASVRASRPRAIFTVIPKPVQSRIVWAPCAWLASAAVLGSAVYVVSPPTLCISRQELVDLGPLIQTTNFDINDLEHLKALFKRADILNSGRLSGTEFASLFGPALGLEHGNVAQLFRIFDNDGNGSIDFKEFVATTDKLVNGSDLNRVGFFFLVADDNASGTLERNEVTSMLIVLNRIATKPINVQSVVSDIFKTADLDGNGSIDKKEVVAWLRSQSASSKAVMQLMRDFGRQFMSVRVAG